MEADEGTEEVAVVIQYIDQSESLDDVDNYISTENVVGESLLNQLQEVANIKSTKQITGVKRKKKVLANGDSLKCNNCKKSYSSRQALQQHKCKDEKEASTACGLCNKTFSSVNTLKRHKTKIHSENKVETERKRKASPSTEFKVSHNEEAGNENDDKDGVKEYDKKKYICLDCGEEFRIQKKLAFHMTEVHKGERHYECPTCQNKFITSADLKRHDKKVHAATRDHVCGICQKAFKDLHGLKRHVRFAHNTEKKHCCHICGSQFKQEYSLLGHCRNIHGDGEHTYECDICQKVFMSTLALNRHKKYVHFAAVIGCCEFCGKSFTSIHNMKNHIQGVRGTERNFKCPVCDMAFKRKQQINDHYRSVHSNERRYACSLCTKAYKKGSHLKDHLKRAHKDGVPEELASTPTASSKRDSEVSDGGEISRCDAIKAISIETFLTEGQSEKFILVGPQGESEVVSVNDSSSTLEAIRVISNYINENHENNGSMTSSLLANVNFQDGITNENEGICNNNTNITRLSLGSEGISMITSAQTPVNANLEVSPPQFTFSDTNDQVISPETCVNTSTVFVTHTSVDLDTGINL